MSQALRIEHRLPSAAEFKALRDTAGWGEISLSKAQKALAYSLHGNTAYDGTVAVGMARLLGDGVMNAYIQDVVVAPPYRGRAIGRTLISSLIKDMQGFIPADCGIGLMAAHGCEAFYSSFGFIHRPNNVYGAGMFAKLSDLKSGTQS
jgi:GNAT superfamily N-acetyltransferase